MATYFTWLIYFIIGFISFWALTFFLPNLKNFLSKKLEEKHERDEKKIINDGVIIDETYYYLTMQRRISHGMTPAQINYERKKFESEVKEKSVRDELKKLNEQFSDNNSETVKIEFDKVMYMLRHYKKRNVISEDGKVYVNVHTPIDSEEPNIFRSDEEIDEQKKLLEPKPQVEKVDTTNLPNIGPMNMEYLPDGSFKMTDENGNVTVVKNNEIIQNDHVPKNLVEQKQSEIVESKIELQNQLDNEKAKNKILEAKHKGQNSQGSLFDENVIDVSVVETENDSDKNSQGRKNNPAQSETNSEKKSNDEKINSNQTQTETSEKKNSNTQQEISNPTTNTNSKTSQDNFENDQTPLDKNTVEKTKIVDVNLPMHEKSLAASLNNVTSFNMNEIAPEQIFGNLVSAVKLQELEEEKDEMEKEKNRLQDLAYKCSLTRANNRTKYLEDTKTFFIEHSNIALAFIDADHFKNVNDTYGHDIGDVTLITLVNVIFENTRDYENVILYRIGGEEFILIFLDMEPEEIFNILENIRIQMQDTIIDGKLNTFSVTLSSGLAFLLANEDETSLMKRAA